MSRSAQAMRLISAHCRGPYPGSMCGPGVSGELYPHGAVCPCHGSSVNSHGCFGIAHPGEHLERLGRIWNCCSSDLCRRERDRSGARHHIIQGRVYVFESISSALAHLSNIRSNVSHGNFAAGQHPSGVVSRAWMISTRPTALSALCAWKRSNETPSLCGNAQTAG